MELREGWNYHNDVGLTLERQAIEIFSKLNTDNVRETIFGADFVETHFIEVIIILLRIKTNYSNDTDDIDEFINDIIKTSNKVNEIDKKKCQEIITKFNRLINSNTN